MKIGEILKRCQEDLLLDDMVTRDRWYALISLRCSVDSHLKSSSWSELIELGVFQPTNGHRRSARIDVDRMYEIMNPNCGPIGPGSKGSAARKRLNEELDEVYAERHMDELVNAKPVV